MPSEITHKTPFHLRNYLIGLALAWVIGYVVGLNHGAEQAQQQRQPVPAVHVTPWSPAVG